MFNKLSASLVIALYISLACPNCLHAQFPGASPAPIPPAVSDQNSAAPTGPEYTSAVSHGYIVTITSPRWIERWNPSDVLSINFTVNHADGTPVTFVSPQGAIKIFAWTDTDFNTAASHTCTASFDKETQQWEGLLPCLDSRDKVVHIEFEIRDPATNSRQNEGLQSTFRFENVPIPIKPNTVEPLSRKFTTDWGTTVTLTGLTLTSEAQFNQPNSHLDFTIEHPKLSDDAVQLYLDKIYDNGASLDKFHSGFNNEKTNGGSITLDGPHLDPGSYAALTFQFTLSEMSFEEVKSIEWKPVQMDIPLAGLAGPKSTSVYTPLGQTTQGAVKYQLGSLKRQDSGMGFATTCYAVWTQSSGAAKYCRIESYQSTTHEAVDFATEQARQTLYWHMDGSPLAPGECGTAQGYFLANNQAFPMYLKTQLVGHDQQVVSFSKVPNPASGQTLVIDQKPDSTSRVPIRLRAISFKSTRYWGTQPVVPATELKLVFEYTMSDTSKVSLAALSARDDSDNTLNFSYDKPMAMMYASNSYNLDPDLQMITVNIAAPPPGSKTIDLKLMLTKDTPVGSPTYFSIDSAGNWTPIDASQFPNKGNYSF
jgi:hypothetical protein